MFWHKKAAKSIETASELSSHGHRKLSAEHAEMKAFLEDNLFKNLKEMLQITDDIKACVRVLSIDYKLLAEKYVEIASYQRQMIDAFTKVMETNLQIMETQNKELRREQQKLIQEKQELMESLERNNDDNT